MWRIDNPRPAVLVVEDDPDVQANLRDILELDGYQVESAPTVKRALQLEDLARFAVVLLDRRLPDGDAVQLLPHLRHWAPQAAVIIITGCTDLDGAVTALRHGATDYILKPLNPDVLRAAIQRIVDENYAARRLRESEERFRLLVEEAKDYAIAMLDPQGHVVSWNTGAQRIIGYETQEIVGRHISCFYREEPGAEHSPDHARRVIAAAESQGRVEVEGWRVRKDGSTFWANTVLTRLNDDAGQLRGFAKITRDCTEKWQAAEELRRERDFAESVIEAAQSIVLVLDIQGRIVRFNPFMENLSGYRLENVQGKDWFETFLPQRERQRIRELFHKATAGIETRGNVNPIVTRSGDERTISWWDHSLHNADGSINGIVAIGHDVTELLDAQHRLVQSERLAAIGQTVASISHECRNELNALGMGLTTLQQLVPKPGEASELIQLLRESQQRLVSTFEDVRGYAAPLRLSIKDCNLASIWQRAWSSLETARSGREAVLSAETDGLDLQCRIDPQRIEQVFRNLFENALQVCDDPVQIWLTCRESRLEGRDTLRISVRDNGKGVPAEQAVEIFSPFFSTRNNGTGLGLAISKRIVEVHGGQISIRTECPSGAEFVVELPRSMAAVPPPEQHPEQETELQRQGLTEGFRSHSESLHVSHRILVVDDSVPTAKIFRSLLKNLGQKQVWLAHDGRTALELADSCRPEVVFLDIGLPDMLGDEVARLLRQRPQRMIIVALTGYEEQDRQGEPVFDAYYVKPISLAMIETALQHPQLARHFSVEPIAFDPPTLSRSTLADVGEEA